MVFKAGGGHKSKDETKKAKTAESKETAKETAEEPSKSPILKAFAVNRVSNGQWSLHVYDIQDGKVINVKVGESEPKSLAVERFKIQFVQHYILGKN